jgi:hypothetical protein
MLEELEEFHEYMKRFYSEIIRTTTKTISTREFKEKAIKGYEIWKNKIEPILHKEIEESVLKNLNHLFETLYKEVNRRVALVSQIKALIDQINEIFLKKVIVPLSDRNATNHESLMSSASFLNLDNNWFSATCSLQLQEVAITLIAKREKIKLDKTNVEKLLEKRIQENSFNTQYEAFSEYVKKLYDIEMPILTTHLRKMRVKVLHEGYNPKPEETESIARFTKGLLQRLNSINPAN